ncbi:aspartyl beta-hydroxylase [Erysipelatoclostridium sp. An15]|uniref:phasin family protein n=1 Tax=unclassified Thomasclavelia TaxID=3025756 RepID=UPI000B3ABD3A|nr:MULTISPECIES: aspartyl beta-hydroxylase [unclassified Thomasclavelia]OUP74436.1 aspartyl beta-hydroxylase [Erysipelatoclostridium sp. An173]OUQ08574.1 aspartyl beta-hydroxylase [Erysipelatoclostridium sp. An15]
MNNFSEDLRKLLLVGIGAVAITAEKSKEVVEDLVKKGELTVEQGKVLNEELKHNVAEKLRQPVSVETVEQDLQKMDVDDLEKLKQKIEELQKSKNESK